MQNAITAAIEAAEIQGKYLNTETLKALETYYQTNELRLQAATKISENVASILKESLAQSSVYSNLTCSGGSLYASRHYAACIRDLDYFLRYATYAMLAENTSILDERVLKGLKETYNSLEISIDATVQTIQTMKNAIASLVGSEAAQEIAIYLDHIIKGLQDSTILQQSEFEAAMQAFEETRKNYRNAFRELAK